MRFKIVCISIASIMLIVSFISCSQDKDQWKGSIEVVDGVTVVKNPKHGIWDKSEIASVKINKELVIGKLDGPEEYLFINISDVTSNQKGDIYISDTRLNMIRKFDRDGKHILSYGKKGQGPGEFQNINNISISSNNDLITFDRVLRRVSIFSDSGGFTTLSKKVLTGSWIDPERIHVTNSHFIFFGKMTNGNTLVHEFDKDWNLEKSYLEYDIIANQEFEELNLGPNSGCFFLQNNGNLIYVKHFYDNKIFIYENERLVKVIERESDIDTPYKVRVFKDVDKARAFLDPEYNFKVFGQGIVFIGITYQRSLGIFRLSDSKIVNFLSIRRAQRHWDLYVEIFDPDGRLLSFSKIGEDVFYDVRHIDSSDRFYAIEKSEYNKVIVFRLEY